MAELITTSLFNDSSLKGYWRMNGDWTDSSPSGYTLTAVNAPTFVSGKYGQAGNFVAASTQYANIGHASIPNIEISGSQTWACWVNQTTLTSYQDPIQLAAADGSNSRGLTTSADLGGDVYFTIPGLTTNTQVNSGSSILTVGTWFHIAGVYNSSTQTLKVYINGVEVGSVTASGTGTAYTNGGFAIGARPGTPASYTNGMVDDAAIFSRALTLGEIGLLAQPFSGLLMAEI